MLAVSILVANLFTGILRQRGLLNDHGSTPSAGRFLPDAMLRRHPSVDAGPVGWMLISSSKSLTDVLSPTPLLMFSPTLVNDTQPRLGREQRPTYFRSSVLAAGI